MPSLRDRDRASIRAFLENNADDLLGRTLDFGSGRQPYRDLVGGEYVPYDRTSYPGSCALVDETSPTGEFDAIICTQMIQYLPYPESALLRLRVKLRSGGVLLMTGPTNWPIVEKEDLWRFTPAGILTLIHRAGFRQYDVEPREQFEAEGETRWIIGWQARAVA